MKEGDYMKLKQNLGIICILIGIILALNNTNDYHGLVETIATYVKMYWPLLISVLGIYLLTTPVKKKK